MPILQLENPTFISVDGAGRVNAGGTVEVYLADGLFSTFATIYSDQVKTTELNNPVTLDDAGTKEIWYDVKVDIREKTKAGAIIRDTENLDPNAGNAVVQGFNLANNGSFEIDDTNDGQPDTWTISPYVGSAIAITETIVTDGTKALEFNTTAAGTGGGVATSAKFPVTEGSVCSVAWSFYATNATTTNTFQIKWYDEDNVLKSTSTLTMPTSGSVPTSWTGYSEIVGIDSAATQGEIVLTGIGSGGSNLSSKAYFDGIIITAKNRYSENKSTTDLDEIIEGGIYTCDNTATNYPIAGIGSGQLHVKAKSANQIGQELQIVTSTVSNNKIYIRSTTDGGSTWTVWKTSSITLKTVQATTSGTTVDFTDIPSWVKRITLIFDNVSCVASGSTRLTIGDSGGLENSGYDYSYHVIDQLGASTVSAVDSAAYWLGPSTGISTGYIRGHAVIENITGNDWIYTMNMSARDPATSTDIWISNGTKSLSGTLDRLRYTTTSTFDAGQVNIMYEG